MRKKILLTVLFVFFVGLANANAALIGVSIGDKYPDIQFDTIGNIVYNASNDKFVLSAEDRTITFGKSGPVFDLTSSASGFKTLMSIELQVDENGKLTGFGTMREWVSEGTVNFTYEGKTYTYGTDTTILSGSVYAFGFDKIGTNLGVWDFLVNIDAKSALVVDGLWGIDGPTGIVASAVEAPLVWDGTFKNDFTQFKVKGDKASLPEPSSLLFFGSALLAIGSLRHLRKKG